MGYRVDYLPVNRERKTGKRNNRVMTMTIVFFMLFLFLTFSYWPEGRMVLREILIPGDSDEMISALEAIAAELQAGVPLYSALETFCRSIFSEGQFDTV